MRRTATCPCESVLPIRLRPDFLVFFEGYTGGPEHWPVAFLHRGRLVEASDAARFFAHPASAEARGFLAGELIL